MRIKNTKGMTITEVIISVLITAIVVTIVWGAWYFVYRAWKIEHIRTNLRVNLEIGLEKIREDLRLSSATFMNYYPSGNGPYSAIGFPMADRNASGFYTIDASYKTIWDKTVVYHIYDNTASGGAMELRRTVFEPRNNNLTSAQRQSQLETVISDGDGSAACGGGERSTTETLFKNLVSLSLSPQAEEFDGYSATKKRSDPFEFGSISLASGEHDISFIITGKNPSSSGYKMGIDSFSIAPSGCQREAEVYLPPQASSGQTASKTYESGWGGDNFASYASSAVGDYITFRAYYDMWVESNFENSTRDNVIRTGNDLYVQLPTFDDGEQIIWQAELEAGDVSGDSPETDFNDGTGNPVSLGGYTFRTIVSSANIDENVDLIRASFSAHSTLYITEVHIDERDSSTNNQNAVNPKTSSSHVQLYFTTPSGNVTPGIAIAAETTYTSNWAVFDFDKTKTYFITFHVSSGGGSYWPGVTSTDINSYVVNGNYAATSTWPVPTMHMTEPLPDDADECYSSPSVYVSAQIEGYLKEGTIISNIYDTTLADPVYNQIAWSESEPSGTSIEFKARSSDNENMSGATAWDSIASTSTNPSNLSIGTGRYVQFWAKLSANPHWTCIDHSVTSVTDANYKAGTITCPTCGKYLIPTIVCPYLDNVKIDWPGETHICDISAVMTQNSDYGLVKVTVDGNDLIKGMQFNLTVYEDFLGVRYEESLTSETEPKNTGK